MNNNDIIIQEIKSYCDQHALGGNLHSVLYDLTIDTKTLAQCISNATDRGDNQGIKVGNLLLDRSEKEREKIILKAGCSWKSEIERADKEYKTRSQETNYG